MLILRVLLNSMTNITQLDAGFNHINPYQHTFTGYSRQALRQNRGLAHMKHFTGIAVITIFYNRYIDINDVAIFELFITGDTVTDNMID